jgi:HTH-type transcriptional regulator/antitoxin HigA
MGRILNDRELKITENKVNELKNQISEIKNKTTKMKGDIKLEDPLVCFLEDLEFEINEYKQIKNGVIPEYLLSIKNIGELLIVLRISKGWTQKELGLKLNMKQSQVARNERNEYYGMSLSNLLKILNVFEVDLQLSINN